MNNSQATRLWLHPILLVSLALLLINDHYLKEAFPGVISGKLSDIAGLICWTWFWLTLLANRRVEVHITAVLVTAVGFVWWKSPLSDAFIMQWNTFMPYSIGRVVDYTDLLALAVLPVVLYKFQHALRQPLSQIKLSKLAPVLRIGVGALAVFAFAATTEDDDGNNPAVFSDQDFVFDTTFLIQRPLAAVVNQNFTIAAVDSLRFLQSNVSSQDTCRFYSLIIPAFDPFEQVELTGEFFLTAQDSTTTIVGFRTSSVLAGYPEAGTFFDADERMLARAQLDSLSTDSLVTIIALGPVLAWRLGSTYEPRPRLLDCN